MPSCCTCTFLCNENLMVLCSCNTALALHIFNMDIYCSFHLSVLCSVTVIITIMRLQGVNMWFQLIVCVYKIRDGSIVEYAVLYRSVLSKCPLLHGKHPCTKFEKKCYCSNSMQISILCYTSILQQVIIK